MTNKLQQEVAEAIERHIHKLNDDNHVTVRVTRGGALSIAKAAIDVMQKHMDERNEALKEAVVELRGISDELKHLEGVYK